MKLSLNESQLHNLIKECVNNVLMELDSHDAGAASGYADRMAAKGDSQLKRMTTTQGENGKCSRNKLTGKRTKTSKDYAAQARRLQQTALERGKKEHDENEGRLQKMYPGQGYGGVDFKDSQRKCNIETNRQQARQGSHNARKIPTFNKKY